MIKYYMLDQDILLELTRPNPNPNIVYKISANQKFCGISSITWGMLLARANTLEGREKDMALSFCNDYLKQQFNIIDFKSTDAFLFGEFAKIKSEKKLQISESEMMTAANAKNNGMILVTSNKVYETLSQDAGFSMENWFETGK